MTLRAGASVKRGQALGRVSAKGRLAVSLHAGKRLSATEARSFTEARARLPQPTKEPVLLLVSQASHELRLYEQGREVSRVEVGFGQAEGPSSSVGTTARRWACTSWCRSTGAASAGPTRPTTAATGSG